MPIHECFAGLRDRLAVKIEPPPHHHTTNTAPFSGVVQAPEEKFHKIQNNKNHETPATPETPEDSVYWQEQYAERAAILEFDGGLSRQQAERLAYEFIQSMKKGNRHAQSQTMH